MRAASPKATARVRRPTRLAMATRQRQLQRRLGAGRRAAQPQLATVRRGNPPHDPQAVATAPPSRYTSQKAHTPCTPPAESGRPARIGDRKAQGAGGDLGVEE